MSGVARVRTSRGTFEEFVAVPKGEPENFPTADEQHAKFAGLVGPYLSSARVDALAAALRSLDEARDIGALFSLTRADRDAPLEVAAAGG